MLESRLGSLRDPDREVAGQVGPSILVLHPCHLKGYGQAHISLKKTWAAHFNMWINNRVDRGALKHADALILASGRLLMSENRLEEAFQIFDKVCKRSVVCRSLLRGGV